MPSGAAAHDNSPLSERSTAELPSGSDSDQVSLKVLDFDGIQQLVASHRGQVVVMDAWSTSCLPCLEEFPHLVELHQRWGADRVACISLSFDYEGLDSVDDIKPRVLDFLKRSGATFDNVLSSEESDGLYRKFDLASVPAVFVYDRAGNLRKRFDNQRAKSKAERFSYAQVGQLVEELLSEPATGRPVP